MIQTEKLNLSALTLSDSPRLNFINGQLSLEDSALEDLPEDLIITDIKTAQRNYPNLFDRLDFKMPEYLGLFCYVPKNTRLTKNLHLLFAGSRGAELGHFVYLEQGSELVLVEEYSALGGAHNIKHYIYLEANAECHLYKLQNEGNEVIHRDECLVQQKRDSRFRSSVISIGAQSAEDHLRVELCETNASCELRAISYAKAKQSIAHHVTVAHLSEACASQQLYKNMAAEQARIGFKGRVIVHPDAQKTSAQQLNQNLLLSSKAEIDAKPELEIYADDVKCSHGSTVGQLDQEALFYLRSRGLSLAQAQQILSCAFAISALDENVHAELVQSLKETLVTRLASIDVNGEAYA